MTTPTYPGHGEKCNGCGLCCRHSACPLASAAGLWKFGRCAALRTGELGSRCDAIQNSWRYPRLAGLTLQQREELTGVAERQCTFRAAFSDAEVERLLDKPNTFANGRAHTVSVVRFYPDAASRTFRKEVPACA